MSNGNLWVSSPSCKQAFPDHDDSDYDDKLIKIFLNETCLICMS